MFLTLSTVPNVLAGMGIDTSQKSAIYIKYNFELASLGKDNLEEIISILRVNGIASERLDGDFSIIHRKIIRMFDDAGC